MKFSARHILPAAASLLLIGSLAGVAHGQAYQVAADEPEMEDLLSPDFGINKKGFRPKEWLEIEARLMVQMAPEPPTKTLDGLTVKWYVAVANPEKRGTYLLFTKEVKHVNIPLGEEIWTSIYLSPASIRRILGDARNAERAVEYVSYEVLINGEVQGYATNNRRFTQGWWNQGGDKLVRSEAVPLLSKPETPFSILWWDRYAEVDPESLR